MTLVAACTRCFECQAIKYQGIYYSMIVLISVDNHLLCQRTQIANPKARPRVGIIITLNKINKIK